MKKNYFKIIALAVSLLIVTIGCKKEIIDVTEVTLDKSNLTLTVGETANLTATVLPKDATNKNVNWTSSDDAVATVAEGKITAKAIGTATITVTTEDKNHTATCAVTVISSEPEKEWIEINGLKWAKCNVAAPGTFASKPEDAGMFYQWNSKIGWSSTDPLTSSTGGTTWEGFTSEGDSWDASNDPCPTGWRVPTIAEQESLISSGSDWAPLNGVNGRFFGNDTQKLFLPAAGYRSSYNGTLTYVRYNGYYWNSESKDEDDAYYMGFSSGPVFTNSYHRNNGFSVRCVLAE